jgi:transcription-repair coupling factor (superfamily II helicase)
MNSIRIKWIATGIGIEKLVMKQGKMICYFVSDQQSDYYQSKRFRKVLDFVQKAYRHL